jgi:hypothetical protein
VVGAGVGYQVRYRLRGGIGDRRVDGHLMLVPIVDGLHVEGGQELFGQSGRGIGQDVAQDGQFIQERGVVGGRGGGLEGG